MKIVQEYTKNKHTAKKLIST